MYEGQEFVKGRHPFFRTDLGTSMGLFASALLTESKARHTKPRRKDRIDLNFLISFDSFVIFRFRCESMFQYIFKLFLTVRDWTELIILTLLSTHSTTSNFLINVGVCFYT